MNDHDNNPVIVIADDREQGGGVIDVLGRMENVCVLIHRLNAGDLQVACGTVRSYLKRIVPGKRMTSDE